MLGGIAKIYIAKSSDIKTTGFSVNGTRKGFALKDGVDWTEITAMRDTLSDSGKVSDYNEFELQASTFGLYQLLNKFLGKRIVCKYITPEGEQRIIGVDQTAFITKSFDSGTKPGDSLGDLIKIVGTSKLTTEVLPIIVIPPVEPKNNGLLYNWFVVNDARGIAPEGWHIPSHDEIQTFLFSLGIGNFSNTGGYFKETGFDHWLDPNTGATNALEFNAKGGGIRTSVFSSLKEIARFWLTDIYESEIEPNTYALQFGFNYNSIAFQLGQLPFRHGLSIRCLKDDDVDPSTVTDIDGNIYPTVKIGNYVWMAENLKVKKYNNGDTIQEVQNQASWNALTEGAWCAYDNDYNNI